MRVIAKLTVLLVILTAGILSVSAQSVPLSESLSETAMLRLYQDAAKNETGVPARWTYEYGVILKGIEAVWLHTGKGKYFAYIQQGLDHFVDDDGNIRTYKQEEYNIDNVLLGRQLLLLYKVTGKEKYAKAAGHIREQLKNHPRTKEGGFWHKQIYPNQMWLDGLYMGEPFYAEYAATFGEGDAAFSDIANQFVWVEQHTRDAKTGLLYHGWDESKKERWSDPETGRSPNIWGRAMGWFAMALVDTLDHFPASNPRRTELLAILNRLAVAIQKYQDPKSGLWYLIVDKQTAKGNYLEASAANMFVYSLAKAVRLGYLPPSFFKVAQKGYAGINSAFIRTDAAGSVNLEGTISVAGLGNKPYRDGSYEYYLSEKVVTNDPKGLGAAIMAANEMEISATLSVGAGKTVLLDSFFNNEIKKDPRGNSISWHYKWGEWPDSGYNTWGNIFNYLGVKTRMLYDAPTAANLRQADIYIIVDPDTIKETTTPNFVGPDHVKAISDWVKAGGVLVLMSNDAGNADFEHFNKLSEAFGIHFNENSRNAVLNNDYAMGKMFFPADHPIFKTARTVYLKEISTFKLTTPAKPIYEDKGDVIMAVAKFGKGTVYALGDPWFYNEYADGRRLPPEYQNYAAARDLATWLIKQSK